MRRTAKHRIGAGFLLVVMCFAALAAGQDSTSDIRPAPYQVAWQDLEFGVIIHFSTNTFLNQEWGDGTASPSVFNPAQFNPEQWMKAIHDAGAKYVVLVAKH
ncbi:MAG TPA: alpha-L-fucosidase, partial [Bryobacteraceae bacterium]